MDNSSVQNRSFLGALAATIKSVCLLVINLVGVGQEAVAMADKAVKVAREKQGVELAISMSDYVNMAITKAAREQAVEQEALQQYIGTDANRKKLVDDNMTRLSKAVQAAQAEIAVSRQ